MQIVKKLTIRLASVTGGFLIFAIIVSAVVIRELRTKSLEEAFNAEIRSAIATVHQSYGRGDLVTMRIMLDQVAISAGWIRGEFKNSKNEPIWTIGRKESASPELLRKVVPVIFENGEPAGTLDVSRDMSHAKKQGRDINLYFACGAAALWLSFMTLSMRVTREGLSSVTSLKSQVEQLAVKNGIQFSRPKSRDEIEIIQGWFSELTASWLKERTIAIDNARNAAIVNSVQAVAHDVRKPFSLIKVLLTTLNDMDTAGGSKHFAKEALREVDAATTSIEDMLQDILQIGQDTPALIPEAITPECLFDDVLRGVFRGSPDADVSIEFSIHEYVALSVDVQKTKRIVANIIQNALQAPGFTGAIWVRGQVMSLLGGHPRMEFVIGNAGSYIPPDIQPSLFGAFFTHNKKGGTGLGLAIARKWVEAHGGQIRCHSAKTSEHPNGFVEFVFDLPLADLGTAMTQLPRPLVAARSSAYHFAFATRSAPEDVDTLHMQQLWQSLQQLDRNLIILALDDEQLYLSGIERLLASFSVRNSVRLILSTPETKEVTSFYETDPDLIILDLDLSHSHFDGLDILRHYRSQSGRALVTIHSNRTDPHLYRTAIDAGADSVLPKPLSKEHFVKLLIETTNRARSDKMHTTYSIVPKTQPVAKKIAVADDSLIMQLTWRQASIDGYDISVFKSPEELMGNGANFDLVITDFNFGNSTLHGGHLAAWVKHNRPHTRVIVFSNQDNIDMDTFDGRIPKESRPSMELLKALLA